MPDVPTGVKPGGAYANEALYLRNDTPRHVRMRNAAPTCPQRNCARRSTCVQRKKATMPARAGNGGNRSRCIAPQSCNAMLLGDVSLHFNVSQEACHNAASRDANGVCDFVTALARKDCARLRPHLCRKRSGVAASTKSKRHPKGALHGRRIIGR